MKLRKKPLCIGTASGEKFIVILSKHVWQHTNRRVQTGLLKARRSTKMSLVLMIGIPCVMGITSGFGFQWALRPLIRRRRHQVILAVIGGIVTALLSAMVLMGS